MSVADLIVPRKARDDERFIIARREIAPDEAEAIDPKLHVRNEERRFHRLIDLHEMQYDSIQQSRSLLILVAVFLVVTQSDKLVAFVKLFL